MSKEKELAIYRVYINGNYVETAHTVDDVWTILGKRPFTAIYEVRSPNRNTSEFVPF